MCKVIIVDDELSALNSLHFYITKNEDIEILGMYQDPLEAIQNIIEKKPDAVFLDIGMPEMDGLCIAAEVLNHNEEIRIVFVTAYDEYAIKAFELNAIDYVLKPFSPHRIEMTVKRMRKSVISPECDLIREKHQIIRQEAIKKRIIKLPTWRNNRIYLCDPHDISCFSSVDGSVKVFTCQGEKYECKDTLSYFDNRMDKTRFFRCHKSYIVNVKKINEVIPWFNSTYLLKLDGLTEDVPVSRNYIRAFRSLFDL